MSILSKSENAVNRDASSLFSVIKAFEYWGNNRTNINNPPYITVIKIWGNMDLYFLNLFFIISVSNKIKGRSIANCLLTNAAIKVITDNHKLILHFLSIWVIKNIIVKSMKNAHKSSSRADKKYIACNPKGMNPKIIPAPKTAFLLLVNLNAKSMIKIQLKRWSKIFVK